MKALDIAHIPLLGHSLIEASAGTGKTYTISQLVLRLLLETHKGLKDRPLLIDEILVVTFTKAATQELKDRIRSNLNEALSYASSCADQQQGSRQDILAQLVNKALLCHGSERTYALLKEALLYLDDAPIFTIHGFCQRLLTDYSFLTAQAYDQTLLENNDDLLQNVAQDVWRQWLYPANLEQALFIQSFFSSPEAVVKKLRPLLDDLLVDMTAIHQPVNDENKVFGPQALQKAFETFNSRYQQAQQYWQDEEADIRALFGEGNGRSFTRKTLPKRFTQLHDYLTNEAQQLTQLSSVSCFCQSFIDEKITKNVPQHQLFECLDQLNNQLDELKNTLLGQMRLHFIQIMHQQQHQQGVFFFDDLVKRLANVLAMDDHTSHQLSHQLQSQYPAALIDEFQDTDQWQYQVFANIYQTDSATCCLMIGDPKQAIYSFRGADINSYFIARNHVDQDQRYTLTTNYRTAPTLVKNVNRLFSKQQNPFYLADFPDYPQVTSPESFSAKKSLLIELDDSQIDSNFSVLRLDGDVKTSVDNLRLQAAEKTALYIQQLLHRQVMLDDEVIKPKDIAILVRNSKQAELMKKALSEHAVNSVYLSKDSVLSSKEADSFLRLLLAVASPFQLPLILAALGDTLIALDYEQIIALKKDTRALQKQQQLFIAAHEHWLKYGFMSMWQQLVQDFHIYESLLGHPSGERAVTNLLQLAEIFQPLDQLSLALLQKIEHFQHWVKNNADSDDFRKLRLETEANLVQIVTIHKSKGLEYNVVCCPFLFEGGMNNKESYKTVFNANTQQRELHWQPSEAININVADASMAEDIRLLYVALTRAALHVNCCWGPVKGVDKSPLYHLLYNKKTALKNLDVSTFWEVFDDLQGCVFDPFIHQPSEVHNNIHSNKSKVAFSEEQSLKIRYFEGLKMPSKVARSYSALLFTSHHSAQNHHSQEMLDGRDRDTTISHREVSPKPAFSDTIFHFPKGSDAGNFMHQVLEDVEFSASQDELAAIVENNRFTFGFDVQLWLSPMIDYFMQCLSCPLAPLPIRLSDLSLSSISKEMAFYLPAKTKKGHIFSTLLKDYRAEYSAKKNVTSLVVTESFSDIDGLFKGFIDLIFEYEGQYYVLDYKSNFLGFIEEDYHFTAMHEAIEGHYYDLQYLIYVAALQRYLKQRLTDYDYDRHIGGVFYVFLRGVNHLNHQDAHGMYFVKPQQTTIDAIEALFCDHQYNDNQYLSHHQEKV